MKMFQKLIIIFHYRNCFSFGRSFADLFVHFLIRFFFWSIDRLFVPSFARSVDRWFRSLARSLVLLLRLHNLKKVRLQKI